jgi:multidrug resistance efflux pump
MSRVEQMRALLCELEALADRAREHEHRMAAGVQQSASWASEEDREWIAWAAAEASVAREDAEARVTQGRALLARAQHDPDPEG